MISYFTLLMLADDAEIGQCFEHFFSQNTHKCKLSPVTFVLWEHSIVGERPAASPTSGGTQMRHLGRWAQGFADSLRWLSIAQTTTAKDEEGKEDMGKGRDEATVMGTQTCWQPAKHSGWCVLWLQCRQCVPSNAKELHCGPVISWQQWQRRLFVWNLIPSAQTLLYTGPNSMESGPKLTKTNQAVTIIHPFFRLNQYKCFLIEFPDI